MSKFLRQSTVSTIKLGPFLSPSDGLSPYVTVGFAVKVAAAGASLAARNDSTTITYDADGYFNVELNATDTATIGRLKVDVPGSTGNYLPVWDEYTVLSQAVYDVLFTAALPAPRALDAVADGSVTFADVCWAAFVGSVGAIGPVSGTSMPMKTPSTHTLVRTKTLDSGTAALASGSSAT